MLKQLLILSRDYNSLRQYVTQQFANLTASVNISLIRIEEHRRLFFLLCRKRKVILR